MERIEFAKLIKAHDSYAQKLLSMSKFANKAISDEVFLSQRINNVLLDFMDKDNPHVALPVLHWGMVSAFIQTLLVQFHGFGIYGYCFLRNAIEFLAIYSLALTNPSIGIAWLAHLKGRPDEYVPDWEKEACEYFKTRHGIDDALFTQNVQILEHLFTRKNIPKLYAIIEKVPHIKAAFYSLMPLSKDEKEKNQCSYKIACCYAAHANFEGMKWLCQESEGGIELQPFPHPDNKEFLVFAAGALTDFHDANVCISSMTEQFIDSWPISPDEFLEVKHHVDMFTEEADKWPNAAHSPGAE